MEKKINIDKLLIIVNNLKNNLQQKYINVHINVQIIQ